MSLNAEGGKSRLQFFTKIKLIKLDIVVIVTLAQ